MVARGRCFPARDSGLHRWLHVYYVDRYCNNYFAIALINEYFCIMLFRYIVLLTEYFIHLWLLDYYSIFHRTRPWCISIWACAPMKRKNAWQVQTRVSPALCLFFNLESSWSLNCKEFSNSTCWKLLNSALFIVSMRAYTKWISSELTPSINYLRKTIEFT